MRPGVTKLVWLETPANPTWSVSDIAAAAEIAHRAGALRGVDLDRRDAGSDAALEFGADIVMHSATKYLNGHSDIIAGALVGARDDDHWKKLRAIRAQLGTILGQTEAWLLMRGMRTLYPARRLGVPFGAVARGEIRGPSDGVGGALSRPARRSPGTTSPKKQMTGGFGGMLSVRIKGGERAAIATAARVELWKRATSLGGVESLIEHRASIEGPGTPCPPDLLRLSGRRRGKRRPVRGSRPGNEARPQLLGFGSLHAEHRREPRADALVHHLDRAVGVGRDLGAREMARQRILAPAGRWRPSPGCSRRCAAQRHVGGELLGIGGRHHRIAAARRSGAPRDR